MVAWMASLMVDKMAENWVVRKENLKVDKMVAM